MSLGDNVEKLMRSSFNAHRAEFENYKTAHNDQNCVVFVAVLVEHLYRYGDRALARELAELCKVELANLDYGKEYPNQGYYQNNIKTGK